MRSFLPLFIALFFTAPIYGQENESDFTFTGFADVYYGYDFSKPLNNSRQFITQAARHNEFNLNWGTCWENIQAKG